MRVLVYDGDCGFCRQWVGWMRARVGGTVEFEPFQSALLKYPRLTPDRAKKAIQYMENDGPILEGAQAFFRVLSHNKRFQFWERAYSFSLLFRALTEWGYRWVADHRALASRLMKCLWGSSMPFSATYPKVFSLITRGIGAIFFLAFISLCVQFEGLWGPNGILPLRDYLSWVREQYGLPAIAGLPTFFWASTSSPMQWTVLILGMIAALLLIFNRVVKVAAPVAWLSYLSWVNVGQVFLQYQWDTLLLESGFTLILASWMGPSHPSIFLFRFLFFRLILSSGWAKIQNGDPIWAHFSSLQYHFETTPLPTILGWYAHHLPKGSLQIATAASLAMECLTPFLFFFARNIRFALFIAHALFQLLLQATGNYGFFNFLTIVLGLSLLEDSLLKVPIHFSAEKVAGTWRWPIWPVVVAAIWAAFSFWQIPKYFPQLEAWYLTNPYGLFSVMTQKRDELIVQGKTDGDWKNYHFKWKPGAPARAPAWVAPHQPRLDWQFWFAALQGCENQRWLHQFIFRLLEGRAEVLQLLAENPFPNGPPSKIRVLRVPYRFSADHKTGQWWDVDLGAATEYCPEVSF